MKDKPYFAVIYMFVITAFFSAVLIGFSRFTRQRVESNVQINFEKAVLEAFPEIEFETNQQIHAIFTDHFGWNESVGAYIYRKEGQLEGYAIPFAGQGFWDDIEGVIGIDSDKRTIRGLAFYAQKETPGLGARIGKTLEDGPEPVGIVPSAQTLDENEVHAITGATQTSIRLETLMNQDLRQWLDAMQNQEQTP